MVETEEWDQYGWSVSDDFAITTPCSTASHLEVGAPVSLKAVTKASLRAKKTKKT